MGRLAAWPDPLPIFTVSPLFRSLALLLLAAAALLVIPAALPRTARSSSPRAVSTAISPSGQLSITATATIDHLAAPPTVENPTQADNGAQLFWLHCQPCHGDRGQGLTDEWREQYPPEDQNCWEAGCHGDRPYENGFTLPTAVPPVIGEGSLERFESLGQAHSFIMAAMPLQAPGHLSEEEYLSITAFLARENGLWEGAVLDDSNVHEIQLGPGPSSGEDAAAPVDAAATPAGSAEVHQSAAPASSFSALPWSVVIALLAVGAAVFWLWRRRNH